MRSARPARLRPRGGFGGYLHELRQERGLSARQLAATAGVHHTYVSKLERGDRQAPDEPVVEALAAALGASPAQLDQLRWRAGLTPRGPGAPGQDDPTLTLAAEALTNPALTNLARDQLRRAIAQAVQGPVSAPGAWSASGTAGSVPPPFVPPMAPAMMGPLASPDTPPDPRGQVLASLLGGWQTVDEAAAELRVTSAYLLSLVQSGQLRAWVLPGGGQGGVGQPGGVQSSPVGVRLRRDDVLALLQPVRL